MTEAIGVIILAAGSSSRLGSSKQLIQIEDTTLLERIIHVAKGAGMQRIHVVLGADAETHREALKNSSIKITVNDQWQKGIGSSIKVGLTSLLAANKDLTSVILLVCDQPFLTVSHIQSLLLTRQKTGKSIVASCYASTTGVPALFSEIYFDSLLSIPDNQGAKSIIEKHPQDTALVHFPDGEYDIDTPEDLEKFLKRTGKAPK
jgi:molybdenum cofactor cytidylyltransferase